MSEITIGAVKLRHGLGLAPMAGVTDRYFRRLCARFGAEYAVTEMVSAKALCYEKRSRQNAPANSASLAYIEEDSIPTAVQLFGSEPEFMAEAAAMVSDMTYRQASGVRPTAIDINMGCPVRKVVSCGEGSALMKTPELAESIVKAVVKASALPVTVKIRSGWDEKSINAPEFAKRLENAGAAAVCVHGRTREQFYAPYADRKVIAAVKQAVKIPVFGNGDIYTADDAVKMLDETGCDGIMVGRGALGNPWLFAEILSALEGKVYTPPTLSERIEVALEHARSMLAESESNNIAALRGQLSWYVKGVKGAAAARASLNSATELSEMESILYGLVTDTENI